MNVGDVTTPLSEDELGGTEAGEFCKVREFVDMKQADTDVQISTFSSRIDHGPASPV